MRRIVLKSDLALGDIVCLTAAVRELHTQFPGIFETDVHTPFDDLWLNNPYVTPWPDSEPGLEWIDCHYHTDSYASVHQSNQHPIHLIEAYCADLASTLGLPSLRPGKIKGDIHLSLEEYRNQSLPHLHYNCQRYWLICAGGKTDFTTKHWPHAYFQRVVDYFVGRIQFVQVGALADGHVHEALNGVIDLRGKTSLRELIQTVHAACGVLCGITGLMHLAAAVPLPPWQKRPRPCVVVAGGREPRSWYGYQTHRILETVGSLPCCEAGGCWQSHTLPMGTVEERASQRLCHRVINNTPKCMAMIRPEEVILNIERILESEGSQ